MPRDLNAFFDLASLFDSFAAGGLRAACGTYAAGERAGDAFPLVQFCEDEDAMLLRALVPGASLADLALDIEDNCLVLRGCLETPQGRYHRHERPVGRFKRVIPLPAPVSDAPVKAVLRDGVLHVTLPKAGAGCRRSIRVLRNEETGETPDERSGAEERHGP
jgi:HSP20 family protein